MILLRLAFKYILSAINSYRI